MPDQVRIRHAARAGEVNWDLWLDRANRGPSTPPFLSRRDFWAFGGTNLEDSGCQELGRWMARSRAQYSAERIIMKKAVAIVVLAAGVVVIGRAQAVTGKWASDPMAGASSAWT